MIKNQFISGTTAEVVPVIGQDYYKTLNWFISNTKKTLDMTVFTTSINKGNSYHKVRKILLNIAGKIENRNIKARIIFFRGSKNNGIGIKNIRVAKKAAEMGIKVRLCSAGIFLHSKLFIADKRYVLLGSHNFSASSMSKNHETSILVESAKMADIYNRYFKKLWNEGKTYG